jgi:hypothetical protein
MVLAEMRAQFTYLKYLNDTVRPFSAREQGPRWSAAAQFLASPSLSFYPFGTSVKSTAQSQSAGPFPPQ